MARKSKKASDLDPAERSTAKVFRGKSVEEVKEAQEAQKVEAVPQAQVQESREDDYKDASWWVKIIYSTQDFLNDTMDTLKFCQLMCFGFLLEMLYLNKDSFPFLNEFIYTVGFNALGVGVALVFSHIKYPVPEGTTKPYPEFEYLYSTLLPLLLQVAHFDASQPFIYANLALNYFVVDKLNPLFQLVCSITYYEIYNENGNMSTLNFAQIAIVHAGLVYALNYFNGGVFKSFKRAEIQLVCLMITNVLFNPAMVDCLPLQIFQKLLISLIVVMLITYPVVEFVPWVVVVPAAFGAFYMLTNYQLTSVLGHDNSVMWLYDYITSDDERMYLIKVWVGALVVSVPIIFNGAELVSLNWRRKIWHFIILGALLVKRNVLIAQAEFTLISLLGSLIVFVVVEIFRYKQYTPLGKYFYQCLRKFQDLKDQGPLNLSYIYLVLGITVPFLYDYISGKVTIMRYVGLVVLGLGDSCASIVGKKYGSVKWRGSQKSVQGTFAFIGVTLVAFRILDDVWAAEFSSYSPVKNWENLFVSTLVVAVLEGSASLNDNLFVPIVFPVTYEVLNKCY